jgi:hypothetical protein
MFFAKSSKLGLVAVLILSGNVLAQSKESAMAQHISYWTVKVDGRFGYWLSLKLNNFFDDFPAFRTSVRRGAKVISAESAQSRSDGLSSLPLPKPDQRNRCRDE